MATHPVREADYTFEEFLDLIPDGEKADLLDGAIYLASPDNTDANELTTWLAAILWSFVEFKDLGKVYTSRVAYRINRKQGPEPDIGFVPKALEATRRRGYINGPPALAVEVVSPDSVARDYVQKRDVYERAGVQEYWILDPDEHRATFLLLKHGHYRKARLKKNIFESGVLPEFYLDARWVAGERRPAAYSVISELLQVG